MARQAEERIVYLLGAGFSAPLGLPLVSNFLDKARDQFAAEPEAFAHFKKIFRQIDDVARVRKAYKAKLHDIEEILSLLEMRQEMGAGGGKKAFEKFVCDVIRYHTPTPKPSGALDYDTWHNMLVPEQPGHWDYARFVYSLLRVRVHLTAQGHQHSELRKMLTASLDDPGPISYGVVTLNYDDVLESYEEFLKGYTSAAVGFQKASGPELKDPGRVVLAKLHGDVQTGRVIPPTWSKGAARQVRDAWRLANQLLTGATQIRVIGYSLPEGDAYVRYLLKSAALESDRLKQFDVVCLDDDRKTVEGRYRRFVEPHLLRFRNANVNMYLSGVRQLRFGNSPNHNLVFRSLEIAHKGAFE